MADNGNGWTNRIVEYGVKRADQFQAHPQNWRTHPKAQREALAASLNGVGWIDAVIENVQTGHLLDGHERLWQALDQGDETPVPYILVDLTEEEEMLVLATFDPITGMAVADAEMLEDILADLRTTELVQDDTALNTLLHEIAARNEVAYGEYAEPAGDPGAQLDRAEELRELWGTARGQVWEIGRHRLMCGDAYSQDDVALLLSEQEPDMLHTDPPYGINIVKPVKDGSAADSGGAKPFGSTASSERKGKSAVAERHSAGAVRSPRARGAIIQSNLYLPIRGDGAPIGTIGAPGLAQNGLYPVIEGDDCPFDPTPFTDFAPVVILWGGNYFANRLPIRSCWIAWDKREDITRNNFADCELAWTNQDKPARLFHHLWNGLHKGSQHGQRRTHPTEKPVALFAEIGKMFAPEGVWIDLFAGTGAQIVAAEQTGATCLGMEIEPLYIAVTLQRLADMGLEPRLTGTECNG